MDRRFEIFVSSTFVDLERERQELQNLIVREGHIPTGMELFAPAFQPAWEIIARYIRECDYYVLVSAGRYGAIDPDTGLSYTEREFEYAQRLEKPTLVLMLSDSGLAACGPDQLDPTPELRARHAVFRAHLQERFVVFYEPTVFEQTASSVLHQWVQQHADRASGWVRAVEQTRKEVYAYLLNRLNPYRDLQLTWRFVRDLQHQLSLTADVVRSLEALIKEYVRRLVDFDIRVYFAYALPEPVEVPPQSPGHPGGDAPFDAHYCLGISTSREGGWMEGLYIGRRSNVDRAFRNKAVHYVPYATRSFDEDEAANQQVLDEGSVIATPILYGEGGAFECIGVVGLSSPREEEVTRKEYRALADEISTLCSALFHAYAQQKRNGAAGAMTAADLRREISAFYRGE